jgi:hypothetical protein
MARVRCITEMGMGVDVHGRDRHQGRQARPFRTPFGIPASALFRMLGKTANDMFVDVTDRRAESGRGGYPLLWPRNCRTAPSR